MRKEYGSEFQLDMEALAARPRASAFEFPEGRARFFRAGRDAIRHLARIERDRCGGVALLPSLCCDSMSEPFVLEGYEVVFFAVDEDLRIDEEGLAEKAGENPGSLLLYMSYFGIAPFAGRFAEEVKERFGLTVVRDATHDFLGRGIEGGAADYVVASLRKWAALPDGAILYSRHRDLGNGRLGVDDDFVARRRDAMTAKQRYLEGDDGVSKEGYLASLAECNAVLDAMGEPCEMSAVSSDILARTDWAAVRDLRKRNASLLTLRFEKAGLRCYCDISTPPSTCRSFSRTGTPSRGSSAAWTCTARCSGLSPRGRRAAAVSPGSSRAGCSPSPATRGIKSVTSNSLPIPSSTSSAANSRDTLSIALWAKEIIRRKRKNCRVPHSKEPS